MPTTALTGTTAPTRYSQTGVAMTMAAADVANGNHIATRANILLLAHNTSTSATNSVTITSVADPVLGRTGNVTAQALAIGEVRSFLLTANGWSNTSDQYVCSASNAAIEFGWMNC